MGRASKGRDYDYGTYRESIFLTQYCGWLCHIRKHGSNCRFIGPVYIGVFLAKNSLIKGMSFTALGTGGHYYHSHIYGIRFGEYFGSVNGPQLENTTALTNNNQQGWNSPVNESATRSMPHLGNSGYHTSSIASQQIVANTRRNGDSPTFPYISVYFWRRTA